MNRREFLRRGGIGAVGATLLAGCSATRTDSGSANGSGDGTSSDPGKSNGSERTPSDTASGTTTTGTPSGTLTVATYSSFTGEDTAGNWLKSAFEKRYPQATVEFETPKNGIDQYVGRTKQGAPIDADCYMGLNTGELVRVRRKLDEPLFASVEDRLDGTGRIKNTIKVDPNGRAIPYDTGYISIVYNGKEVEAPKTFETLLKPHYAGKLITENAQQSDPGRAFLLWSILQKGENGYLDYWKNLLDNGVRVLSDWEPAYNAFTSGEAPMVVSYSTDQVYYHESKSQLQRHQIGFLNDQGYANPELMALFADANNPKLGRAFMEFVLTKRAQAQIAVKNVQFPAVTGVTPTKEFAKYAKEPPKSVTMSYDDLAGSVGTWIEDWARLVASN